MKTAFLTIACLLGGAAVPGLAQDSAEEGPSETFEEAFGAPDEGDAAASADGAYHEEAFGDWRAYDALTTAGDRRVYMHKDLGPERYIEFDMFEGGSGGVTFVDAECGFGSSFDIEELGEDRAAGLAEKFADMLDDDSCDARSAIPTSEELADPLSRLDAWVAERPFPAASYWKSETRVLEIGEGEGRGVGRYEGRVSVVYVEPDAEATGPAEVRVNIYECDAFGGRTLPVASGDPAEAQEIALAVLNERAEACGLDPETPARIVAGLPEGLAADKAYRASLEADDYDPYADEIEDQADLTEPLPEES